MIRNNTVYIVTMYKYKMRNNHNYILGIFDKKAQAVKAAEKEQKARGGTK